MNATRSYICGSWNSKDDTGSEFSRSQVEVIEEHEKEEKLGFLFCEKILFGYVWATKTRCAGIETQEAIFGKHVQERLTPSALVFFVVVVQSYVNSL
jgi:hypothetical protein